MFTGIISYLATLEKKENSTFSFKTSQSFYKTIGKGSSISVNGVCLTIINKSGDHNFSVNIMPETAKRTMLGRLKIGDLVNLELPVTATQPLSGHLVQGHVDGVGRVKRIRKEGNSRLLAITISKDLDKYIVEKGSIAVNGISLTVIGVNLREFTVGIIPYTWHHTMLKHARIGDFVNIEVDILAKYIEKLLQLYSGGRHTEVDI